MDIAWIGHAAFRLRGRDAAVVTDPCPSNTGFRLNRPQADIVTVSNADAAHSWVKGVAGDFIELSAPGEFEIKNVLVVGATAAPPKRNKATVDVSAEEAPDEAESVPDEAAPDEAEPEPGERQVAFVIEIDEVIVAHLGDMRTAPSGYALDELNRADVVLIPVGGHGHMDATLASSIIGMLEPRLVIPMLYKVGPEQAELDGVEAFLKAMGAEIGQDLDNHINVTRSSLPERTTVHVLTPRGDSPASGGDSSAKS